MDRSMCVETDWSSGVSLPKDRCSYVPSVRVESNNVIVVPWVAPWVPVNA